MPIANACRGRAHVPVGVVGAARTQVAPAGVAVACRCADGAVVASEPLEPSRRASSRITTPTAFSAPVSSQPGSSDLNRISGTPITSSVSRVARAPPRAEPRGAAHVAAVGGHQRGDRHEVVGVRGVPQAQDERDAERGQQRRAVEQACEPRIDVLDRVEEEVEVHALGLSRLRAHSGHRPEIGKWVKRASQPVSSRTRSRTASSSAGVTALTGRTSRRRGTRFTAAPASMYSPGPWPGGSAGPCRPPRASRGCGRPRRRRRGRPPVASASAVIGSSARYSASSISRRTAETRSPCSRIRASADSMSGASSAGTLCGLDIARYCDRTLLRPRTRGRLYAARRGTGWYLPSA